MDLVLERFGVDGEWESVLTFPSVPTWEMSGKPQWERFPPKPIRLRLWRLLNDEPIVGMWMVRELRMYHDTECRDEVQRDSYSIISSGARGFGRPAAHAFDEDHDTWWSSPCSPCSVGEAWLGVDVGKRPMKIRCVRLWQEYVRPNVTTSKLSLQFWNGSQWAKSTNWVLQWPDARWKWRVVGEVEKGNAWSVTQIDFFMDACNSTTPALRSGQVVFSEKTYEEAANVRDNDQKTAWMSNPCISDSGWCMPWIGIEFSRSVDVECALVHQKVVGTTHAKHLRVEYWSGARWEVKWRLMHARGLNHIPADIPLPPEDSMVDWALVVSIIAVCFGSVVLCYFVFVCTRRDNRDGRRMEFDGNMRKKVSKKLAIMNGDASQKAIDLPPHISIEDRRPFWSPHRAIAWEPQPQLAEHTRHQHALEWYPPNDGDVVTPRNEDHPGIRRDPRLQRPLRYHERVIKHIREAQDWVRWKLGWKRVIWMDFTPEPEEEAGPEKEAPKKLGRIAKLLQCYRELPKEHCMRYVATQAYVVTRDEVKKGAHTIADEYRNGFPVARKKLKAWQAFARAQIANPLEKYEENTALVPKLRWRLQRSYRTAYNYVVGQGWYHPKNPPDHFTQPTLSTRKTAPSFEIPRVRSNEDDDDDEDRIDIRTQSSTLHGPRDDNAQHLKIEDIGGNETPLPLPPAPPTTLFTAPRGQGSAPLNVERSGPTVDIMNNMPDVQRHFASSTLSHLACSDLIARGTQAGDIQVEDVNSGEGGNDTFTKKEVTEGVCTSRVTRVTTLLADRMTSLSAAGSQEEKREVGGTQVSEARQTTGSSDSEHRGSRRDVDETEGNPVRGSMREFMESSETSELLQGKQHVLKGKAGHAALEGQSRFAEHGIAEEAIATLREGHTSGKRHWVVKGMPKSRHADRKIPPDMVGKDLTKEDAHDEISVRSFDSCET